MYSEYKKLRLQDKTLGIFSAIHRTKNVTTEESTADFIVSVNAKKETEAVQRFISYAETRNFSLDELFKYELTNVPLFLFGETGLFKKSDKSELSRQLLGMLKSSPLKTAPVSNALIIDFMAYCRKVAVKKLGLENYDKFAEHILTMFLSLGSSSDEIHIIFDIFQDSFKNYERIRRLQSKTKKKLKAIPVTILSGEQKLPASMESFWPLSSNKLQLQRFIISHIREKYTGAKPIYLAGAHEDDTGKCMLVQSEVVITIPELSCSHEEADDRILFHIQHITNDRTDISSIVVATEDTDVIVSLLYHQLESFKNKSLLSLWLNKGSGSKRLVYPIHTLISDIGEDIIRHLPAAHALTGADTTSKVGTKLAMMSQRNMFHFLNGFGMSPLSEEMLLGAEGFLIACIDKSPKKAKTFEF